MPNTGSARMVLRLGGALLLTATAVGVWEVLASQAPGSILYVGVLPGPVERLRNETFDFGVVILIAGLLLGDREVPRRVIVWLALGSVLVVFAGLYAALTGMTGVQMTDLRPDATWLFAGKLLGRGLLCAGLANIGWKTLVV
ncbi:MAG TPA: hypothetical protein VFN67_22620 [Polyangiales bacterium]|nr:hypothetical protein [Polyangiales bacterium]